jgi:hypothetical protein
MTKDQINASLDAMLENPKAKTFLNHLVRAYMPQTNVTKVVELPKGDFKCVLTRAGLTTEENYNKVTKSEAFQLELKSSSESTATAAHEAAVKKLVGTKELGVTGKDTTTFMSASAYEIFADWIVAKSLKKDKHINWLLGAIRRESLMARAENIDDKDVQKKVADFKKHNSISKPATFSLSDSSDVLSKLKAAMEANNN